MKLKIKLVAFFAILFSTQVAQSTVVWFWNATESAIQVWVNCNLIFDSKNKPFTITPQIRLSVPFIQKPLCNVGSKDWANGFFWVDGEGKYWKADEVTALEMLGNDLYIIGGNGSYTRIILPSGLVAVDIGRLIVEKIVDLKYAIEQKLPLDAFFKTIGIPGVSIAVKQAQYIADPSKLY